MGWGMHSNYWPLPYGTLTSHFAFAVHLMGTHQGNIKTIRSPTLDKELNVSDSK